MKNFTWCALLAGALAALSFACMPTSAPPTKVQVFVPTSIPPTPSDTPESPPTEALTLPPPTLAPTLPLPTEAPLPTEPPPPTEPPSEGLAILFFNVTIEDIPTGKRLTFTWQTTGAAGVTIWSGTKQRFPDAWAGPPNGSLVKDLAFTYYRNPSMTLVARDDAGHTVSKSVIVEWACEHDYFFSTDIARCPAGEASASWAAEQPFEHGRMIWLEDVGALAQVILVLYDDGQFALYEDTWTEGQPESDPSFVPPAGLLQPVRGFGKLWRENASVRDKLGWAMAGEQGFDTVFQAQIAESIGATAFLRALDGKIIRVSGWDVGVGTWEYETP
ncbi:MAG: hypothetical protein JW918_15400 [Anaerolineae bacterium]|nr:hypothetical protein [Anaerolineae bacterium]